MTPGSQPPAAPNTENDPPGELQPIEAKLEATLEPATLEATLETIVSAVPRQKRPEVRQAVATIIHQVEERYSGPLPHPQHLEMYERTLPGAADRILTMAEKEQDHRHAWEDRELRSSIFTETVGRFGGIGVAVALVVGAVFCAVTGANAIGVALVTASAVSMVPAIIKGREWLHSSEEPKADAPAAGKKRPPKNRRRAT